MNVGNIYYIINLDERMLQLGGGPDHQSDAHPTEPPRLATYLSEYMYLGKYRGERKKKKKKEKKRPFRVVRKR